MIFVKKWNEFLVKIAVAPFVGAWIEIVLNLLKLRIIIVAPFVGAWIEISVEGTNVKKDIVAPFVGAWIEIGIALKYKLQAMSRSLRGSVD